MFRKILPVLLLILAAGTFTYAEEAPAPEAAAPVVEKNNAAAKAESATEKTEKAEKGKKKKQAIKLADDKEDPPPAEKDPSSYQLSNRKLVEEYTTLDRQPYDRGEHIFISAFFGALGGAVVGGLVGFSQYNKDNETASTNALYAFGGGGAAAGAVSGIFLTFFEQGKIEQFGLGKFLLKYSWYGAVGGAVLGAGVGLIPYSSSQDYGDIFRYGGYGAGIGFAAGLALFFIDLPDHLRLFTYRREDQNLVALTLRF